MITPRVTRLVRVPDLRAMRAAVAQLVVRPDPSVRQSAVIVPTRGAAEELRVALENRLSRDARVLLLPEVVTRAELYQRFHAALAAAPRLLTDAEREVLLRRASREAAIAGAVPPFRPRPGLIVQMLEFYDELRRREKTLDDFERLATAPLAASAPIDRGAERLLRQTEFLCAAFSAFERHVAASGAVDEHGLRSMLLNSAAPQRAFNQIVITGADRAADPRGLYGCDFDLVARIAGVSRVDVVATEALLASGFHERLHELLPGIEEERWGEPAPTPVLIVPESAEPDRRWFVCRDREEEMTGVVRWLHERAQPPHDPTHPPHAQRGGDESGGLERFGIAFARPLPYLYLAKQVFADARLPYQALDSLPLSAEPFAAAIDVILSFLASQANRTAVVEMLRSPHLIFSRDVSRQDVAALDAELREAGYAGGWERLAELPDSMAVGLIRAAALELQGVMTSDRASGQIGALLQFIRRFERLDVSADGPSERHLRARSAILAALESVRDAHAAHDDDPLDLVELTGSVRRWIEAHTFSPRTGSSGVRLLDAASAPYSDLDGLRVVGLVEGDWPEPARRSIFYPMSILSSLGWPADASQASAARARFRDLLTTATTHVSLSTFTLEDDAIVPASPLLEEVEPAGLPVERWPAPARARVFTSEYMEAGVLPPDAEHHPSLDDSCAAWLELRVGRTAAHDGRFSGFTGPRPTRTYAVSYLERYLDCPFKYFAAQVLRLPEEREEEAGLTPIERGHFLHDVFEVFFREWQASGRATITTANVADALELFEAVATRKLETLPPADRALERNYLLGSAAASGLAERAFAFEIEQGGEVVERLLEHVLEGEFALSGTDGPRRVHIKAKADRIDLMADGTLRIIDYKSSRAPKPGRALQLPIYGVIAQQALDGHLGRSWTVGAAGYVAFKEKEAFVPLGGRNTSLQAAIAEGQQRMLGAIDAIERGEFPVKPDEPFRCQWCGYAGVCRKDYVGDE